MKNIVLIGMPGAGKSTTGVVLAKTLGMSFIDTDLLIQSACGRQLQQIIDEQGAEAFLQIENDVIAGLKTENTVIATGGSVIFGPDAMKSLKYGGVTLYIELPLPEILRRLSNIKTRGIAMPRGTTIADIYRQRIPLYEKYADSIIPAQGLSLEETVQAMVDELAKKLLLEP